MTLKGRRQDGALLAVWEFYIRWRMPGSRPACGQRGDEHMRTNARLSTSYLSFWYATVGYVSEPFRINRGWGTSVYASQGRVVVSDWGLPSSLCLELMLSLKTSFFSRLEPKFLAGSSLDCWTGHEMTPLHTTAINQSKILCCCFAPVTSCFCWDYVAYVRNTSHRGRKGFIPLPFAWFTKWE